MIYLTDSILSRMNKDEISEAIKDYFQETVNKDDFTRPQLVAKYNELKEATFKVVNPPKTNKRKVANTQLKDALALKRVIIQDTAATESIDDGDDESHRVFWISWGNDVIGDYQSKVVFDTPWHVHEGALKNLRQVTTERISVKENGIIRSKGFAPRFIITELEPLSEEQLSKIGKEQLILEKSN